MVTSNTDPNIDGTIRIVIEYDESKSGRFDREADKPVFSSSSPQSQNVGKFDISGIQNEIISIMKDVKVITSSLVSQMNNFVSGMKNYNETIKIMSEEARKDARFRAENSRKNRGFNREQERRDDINAPRVEREQYKTGQEQEKLLQSVEKTLQETFKTDKVESSAQIEASRVVDQLQKTERALIESQEKVSRENRLTTARIRRDNKDSNEKVKRDGEKHELDLLKSMEGLRKAVADASIREAQQITAEEYAADAGLRRQAREHRNQLRLDFADVDYMAGEERRKQQLEKQRVRDLESQYGQTGAREILHREKLEKRFDEKKWTEQFNKDKGIGGWQEKQFNDIKGILNNLIGVFTIGTAFKNSKVANNLLGTISTILGTLMDVFLTPFLPMLVPVIQWMAKLIPTLQKFIQDFTEDPFGTLVNTAKDAIKAIFSRDFWAGIFNVDVLKGILGVGGGVIGIAAILGPVLLMNKLFGAGTNILGRSIASLFNRITGRGSGAGGEVATNVMFSRSVGGFTGAVTAFTRAVGAFGLRSGLGGGGLGTTAGSRFAGSRFATTPVLQRVPGVNPSVPGIGGRTVGFTGATIAASSGLQRVPGVIGTPGIGRGTVGFTPLGGASSGGGLGTTAAVANGVGTTTNTTLGRSSRIMSNSSVAMSRSATAITRMGGTIARILPAIAGLAVMLGPLALAAGLLGLGIGFGVNEINRRLKNKELNIEGAYEDPTRPRVDVAVGGIPAEDLPEGSVERAEASANQNLGIFSIFEALNKGRRLREEKIVTPQNIQEIYGTGDLTPSAALYHASETELGRFVSPHTDAGALPLTTQQEVPTNVTYDQFMQMMKKYQDRPYEMLADPTMQSLMESNKTPFSPESVAPLLYNEGILMDADKQQTRTWGQAGIEDTRSYYMGAKNAEIIVESILEKISGQKINFDFTTTGDNVLRVAVQSIDKTGALEEIHNATIILGGEISE